jgi:hypothetical protein
MTVGTLLGNAFRGQVWEGDSSEVEFVVGGGSTATGSAS